MEELSVFLNTNLLSVIVVLLILIAVLSIISIYAVVEVKNLRKRYENFTGGKRKSEYTMEAQFTLFHKEAERMEQKFENLAILIKDMEKSLNKCVQKVGVVRYNPFENDGGNLCYAIALLDINNNGIVINGIHGRTGSFTYAKPIELGVSQYQLSNEESQAIQIAKDNSHTPCELRQKEIEEIFDELPRVHGKTAIDYSPEDVMSMEQILDIINGKPLDAN